jgi:hypothetical protein
MKKDNCFEKAHSFCIVAIPLQQDRLQDSVVFLRACNKKPIYIIGDAQTEGFVKAQKWPDVHYTVVDPYQISDYDKNFLRRGGCISEIYPSAGYGFLMMDVMETALARHHSTLCLDVRENPQGYLYADNPQMPETWRQEVLGKGSFR